MPANFLGRLVARRMKFGRPSECCRQSSCIKGDPATRVTMLAKAGHSMRLRLAVAPRQDKRQAVVRFVNGFYRDTRTSS
jgi:hypothetical protein